MWPLKQLASAAHDNSGEDDRMQSRINAGLWGIAFVFGGMGVWSVTFTLDGAVVTTGVVQVEAARKKVQHLEGGIVKEVRVRDGDAVAEGDVLIRLDDTSSGANLRLLQGQSAELAVRRYRLLAERDGAAEFNLPEAARVRADRALNEIAAGQRAFFEARRSSRQLEIDLLRQQQVQLKSQIGGFQKQEASKVKQIQYYDDELDGLRTLFKQGLTPKSRLLALEREAERGRGEMAALTASMAGAETKLHEIELAVLKINQTFHEKVTEELRAVEAELNTFSQRLVSVEDQTQRAEIRAPRRGRVLNLAVHNPGSVIKAGETIMEIVPEDDMLVVAARIAPQDIDKVAARAPAVVRLSAFNQRTTPELSGEVQRVSADLVADTAGGQPSYQAIIEIPPRETERLQGLVLQPGMPAEVFIRTGSRTPLGYLLKPLTDTFSRALREE
jgi:HlyD family type I secretion membrane fusion protein